MLVAWLRDDSWRGLSEECGGSMRSACGPGVGMMELTLLFGVFDANGEVGKGNVTSSIYSH